LPALSLNLKPSVLISNDLRDLTPQP
jgi:hypothetical protein